MSKIRVLLALDSPLLRELLRKLIDREPDIEVVDEVDDPVDLLLGADLANVNAVVHAWPSAQMPGICTLLLGEYPDLLLVGIPRGAECAYACRQAIATTPLPNASLDDLIKTIREGSTLVTDTTRALR